MQANQSIESERPTFTDLMRLRFKGILDGCGGFLNSLGITPNTMTLMGLAGNLIGSLFLARGEFLIGGLIVLFFGPIDALDGAMARLRGESGSFGAFIDSVTDRYSELLIFGGLLVYYIGAQDLWISCMVFASAAGSVLVSYIRARAEALNYQARGGLLTRMERYIVLVPSLILGYPRVGIVLVAVLANLTAIQRIFSVRKQARQAASDR
jgi:CDP-diacylglycerol---glycerol-3-phosphate 3-phosphatidyltransferase